MTMEKARELRRLIEKASASLDDRAASMGAELFPRLKYDGSLIAAGTRINWNGTLKIAAVDLWDEERNSPDNAPTLWQSIAYREGIRIIPATIAAETAFAKGERGWWGDAVYESLIDANVHTPEQYPDGWGLL